MRLLNIWRRRLRIRLKGKKTALSTQAREQIKKLGSLGQELVIMRMG